MAVDGPSLVLKNHPTVNEEFGFHLLGPNSDVERSLALCLVFLGSENFLAVNSKIASYPI